MDSNRRTGTDNNRRRKKISGDNRQVENRKKVDQHSRGEDKSETQEAMRGGKLIREIECNDATRSTKRQELTDEGLDQ